MTLGTDIKKMAASEKPSTASSAVTEPRTAKMQKTTLSTFSAVWLSPKR